MTWLSFTVPLLSGAPDSDGVDVTPLNISHVLVFSKRDSLNRDQYLFIF